MAEITADRVLESSTTTGTGSLTLAGAITGYRAFASVCANGDTVRGYIEAVDSNGIPTGDWETGIYTWGTGGILARTTVQASSNAGAAVAFAAGTKRIGLGIIASKLSSFSVSGVAAAVAIHSAMASAEMKATSPTPPIIDQLATAPVSAYAFYKLRAAYAGKCCQIRRASDNATLDLGFTPDGRCEIDKARAFAKGTTPYVSIMYDQQGSNNAVQTTAGLQPEFGMYYTRNGMPYFVTNGNSFMNLPVGLAVTDRRNSSVWTAFRPHTLRVGFCPWTLGATGVYALESAQSVASVQMKFDGSNTNVGWNSMKGTAASSGSVMGVDSTSAGVLNLYVRDEQYTGTSASTLGTTGGLWPDGLGGVTSRQDSYALLVFNSSLSVNDRNTLAFGLASALNLASQTLGLSVFQGDSNTSGGGPDGYNHGGEMLRYVNSEFPTYHFGLNGQTAATEASEAATYVDTLLNTTVNSMCVLTGGSNDVRTGVAIATIQATFTTWATDRRTAGWKYVGHMTVPKAVVGTGGYTQTMEDVRAALASWQRANTGIGRLFDFLIDCDLEPRLNPWNSVISADNLHFGPIGFRLMSYPIAEQVCPRLIG